MLKEVGEILCEMERLKDGEGGIVWKILDQRKLGKRNSMKI